MDSNSNWNGKPIAPNALRPGHDKAQHQSSASAIEESLRAAHSEKNREVAKIASNPRVHEIIEDEVIHPAVVVIGK